MSRSRARVTVSRSAPTHPGSGATDAPVRSALPERASWVSSAAVRQAIGAWAYTRGAGERRPDAEAVRVAVGVACAVREIASDPTRGRWSGASETVVEEIAELSVRSGFRPPEVESAIALLTAAAVVTRQSGGGGATVTLTPDVLTPAPIAAALDWQIVRERLVTSAASIAPALAVLRELAASMGALDVANGAMLPAATRASVRDLEDTTGFGRSTVADAVASLERARLIDVEARVGRTTRFTLRPSAFGRPDEPPAAAASDVSALTDSFATPTSSAMPRLAGAPSAAASPQAAPAAQVPGNASVPVAGATTLIGTFAGTPIYAPPGTPFVVDCDASGQWTCRVGPFLVLGPVRASD